MYHSNDRNYDFSGITVFFIPNFVIVFMGKLIRNKFTVVFFKASRIINNRRVSNRKERGS